MAIRHVADPHTEVVIAKRVAANVNNCRHQSQRVVGKEVFAEQVEVDGRRLLWRGRYNHLDRVVKAILQRTGQRGRSSSRGQHENSSQP